MKQIKKDAILMVKNLKERNPELSEMVGDNKPITLEDFAEIVIVHFCAYNCINMNTFIKNK